VTREGYGRDKLERVRLRERSAGLDEVDQISCAFLSLFVTFVKV